MTTALEGCPVERPDHLVHPAALEAMALYVRTEYTEPRLAEGERDAIGYWNANVSRWDALTNFAADDRLRLHDFLQAATQAAETKQPDQCNGFDWFVMLHTSPHSLGDPAGRMARHGLRHQIISNVVASLQDGKLPEGFESPAALQGMATYLVLAGLANFSVTPNRPDKVMQAGLDTLLAATLYAPGFDPAAAGLHAIYDRAIAYASTIRADHSLQLSGRMNTGKQFALDALDAAEHVVAALYLRKAGSLPYDIEAEATLAGSGLQLPAAA
ncbi:MAG TPA: hypothetical protein VLF40_02880 [Candidatus Saccharimonadales bacterium]|nr:hypothetical protein [Candidatus Saccharimonadales bacterium]